MMRSIGVVAMLAAGCSVGVESTMTGPDAATAGQDASGGGDAGGGCKSLFLSFEGGTVTAGLDDAAANRSSLATSTRTLTAFAPGDPARAMRTAAIRDQVAGSLAGLDLTVTTTRPTSGAYHMLLLGGQPGQLGVPSNVAAVAPASCGAEPAMSKGVGFVFELAGVGDVELANLAVQSYGVMIDVPFTTRPGDCMCQTCDQSAAACTLGGASTAVDAARALCGESGTIDVRAEFGAAITCP